MSLFVVSVGFSVVVSVGFSVVVSVGFSVVVSVSFSAKIEILCVNIKVICYEVITENN
jgi:hypothetical protein